MCIRDSNSEKEDEQSNLDWASLFSINQTPALKMTATQPPTVINFGMLAKPSIYTHTLDEDIREFIQTFENESVANDWDDNTKLKKIRIAFKGIALKIFDEKIKDESQTSTVKTWAGMKAKILETFKKKRRYAQRKDKKKAIRWRFRFFRVLYVHY